jgi:hypothetical protein
VLISIGNDIRISAWGGAQAGDLRGVAVIGLLIRDVRFIVGWLLAGIYILRLFTEWQGRVLLGIVVLAFVCSTASVYVLAFITYPIDLLTSGFHGAIWEALPWAVSVVSILLLYASFRSRKAFLE